MQLCGSLSILWHCLSLGLEWKLTFQSHGLCWVFQICWCIECSTSTASRGYYYSLVRLNQMACIKDTGHLWLWLFPSGTPLWGCWVSIIVCWTVLLKPVLRQGLTMLSISSDLFPTCLASEMYFLPKHLRDHLALWYLDLEEVAAPPSSTSPNPRALEYMQRIPLILE